MWAPGCVPPLLCVFISLTESVYFSFLLSASSQSSFISIFFGYFSGVLRDNEEISMVGTASRSSALQCKINIRRTKHSRLRTRENPSSVEPRTPSHQIFSEAAALGSAGCHWQPVLRNFGLCGNLLIPSRQIAFVIFAELGIFINSKEVRSR